MHGEFGGMAEANVLDEQLQTGQIEKTNIFSAVKDSGAVDITVKVDQKSNDNAVGAQVDGCEDAEYVNKECHKGTQTESRTLFDPDIVYQGRKMKPLEKSL